MTVQPVPGESATIADLWIVGAIQHVRFDGITFGGGYLSNNQNLTISNSRDTQYLRVDTQTGHAGRSILFDHDTFDNIAVPTSGTYEGSLSIRGYENTSPVGVTVQNSHFGNGTSGDGIQITADTYGVRILDNVFSGILQANANGHHSDPVQFVGGCHCVLSGNLFINNSTGLMAPDGGDGETITNNVFVQTEYSQALVMGGWQGSTVTHNTLVNGGCSGCGTATFGDDHHGTHSSNDVIRDNVLGDLNIWASSVNITEDHNLIRNGAVAASDITGSPTFTGGASPTTYAGFDLAAGSLGKGRASDGTDIGIP